MPGIRLLYSAGNPAERRKACMELSRSRLLPTLTADKTYSFPFRRKTPNSA